MVGAMEPVRIASGRRGKAPGISRRWNPDCCARATAPAAYPRRAHRGGV